MFITSMEHSLLGLNKSDLYVVFNNLNRVVVGSIWTWSAWNIHSQSHRHYLQQGHLNDTHSHIFEQPQLELIWTSAWVVGEMQGCFQLINSALSASGPPVNVIQMFQVFCYSIGWAGGVPG